MECPVPGGRLDACSSGHAVEVERSGSRERLDNAARKLGASGRKRRVLQVPHHHMELALEALRSQGVSGTVKNMGGTKSRRVNKSQRRRE
jgi:hypothetical protein